MKETMILVSANFTPPAVPPTVNIVQTTQAAISSVNAYKVSTSGIPKDVSPVPSMILIAIWFKIMAEIYIVYNA